MERNAVELCVKLHMTQHSRKKKLFKIPFSHTIWCALYHSLLFHDVFDGLPQFFCFFILFLPKTTDGQLLRPPQELSQPCEICLGRCV